MDQATGELADAIARDLFNAGRNFNDLGWRGLWAYVVAAQPGTAVHYRRCQGWTISDKLLAENLYGQQKIEWLYTARNFEKGRDQPIPEAIDYPGRPKPQTVVTVGTEESTLDDIIPPHVRALIQGG